MSPTRALVELNQRLLRRQGLAFAAILGLFAYATAEGFRAALTVSDREILAKQLAANPGFQALYGVGRQLDTVSGFASWRFAGTAAVIAGVWGLLAATRSLAGEEESGRADLVMAGAVTRRAAMAVPISVLDALFGLMLLAVALLLMAGGVGPGDALLIGFQVAGGALIFAAVGAITSQLLHGRRMAAGTAGLLLGAAFLTRVVADGTRTLGWLRWLTPFGWIEQAGPKSDRKALAIALIIGSTAVLSTIALILARRRDVGEGLLVSNRPPRTSMALLGSPGALAIRGALGPAAAWAAGVGATGLVFGLLADDVAKFIASSSGFEKFASRIGASGVLTAASFIGVMFTFLVVPVALFASSQIAACRTEESAGRLEITLAGPVDRRRWLTEHALVAAGGALAVALAAALTSWAGTAFHGHAVPLGDMVKAGANCLPAALMFYALGALTWAIRPQWTASVAFGSVVVAFLLQLIGSVIKAPDWVLDLSPFHHFAPAPAEPINGGAAVVMLALSVAAIAVASLLFRRRDLAPA